MTGCIAFLLITIFLNPVFLNNGIQAIGKIIEVRLSAFHIYQETYKDVALLSVSERFLTVTKMIFFRYSRISEKNHFVAVRNLSPTEKECDIFIRFLINMKCTKPDLNHFSYRFNSVIQEKTGF